MCSSLCLKVAGWWYTYPSEKYEFVSWDDDIPNGNIKTMFQTSNQVVIFHIYVPKAPDFQSKDSTSPQDPNRRRGGCTVFALEAKRDGKNNIEVDWMPWQTNKCMVNVNTFIILYYIYR